MGDQPDRDLAFAKNAERLAALGLREPSLGADTYWEDLREWLIEKLIGSV